MITPIYETGTRLSLCVKLWFMCLRMNNYMYSAGITFIVRLFLLILLLLLALSHVDKLLLIAIFFLILLLRPSLPSFFLSCALPLSLFFSFCCCHVWQSYALSSCFWFRIVCRCRTNTIKRIQLIPKYTKCGHVIKSYDIFPWISHRPI